jgi:hypothetical protein
LEDSGVDLPENGNEDTSSSKKKATWSLLFWLD